MILADRHNPLMSYEKWLENRIEKVALGAGRFLHRVFGDAEMHWLVFEDGQLCTADFCELDGKSYVVDAVQASPFGDEYPEIGWASEARVRGLAALTTASTSTSEKLTRGVTLTEITDSAIKLRVVNLAVSEPLRARAAAALSRVAVFEVTAALPALSARGLLARCPADPPDRLTAIRASERCQDGQGHSLGFSVDDAPDVRRRQVDAPGSEVRKQLVDLEHAVLGHELSQPPSVADVSFHQASPARSWCWRGAGHRGQPASSAWVAAWE